MCKDRRQLCQQFIHPDKVIQPLRMFASCKLGHNLINVRNEKELELTDKVIDVSQLRKRYNPSKSALSASRCTSSNNRKVCKNRLDITLDKRHFGTELRSFNSKCSRSSRGFRLRKIGEKVIKPQMNQSNEVEDIQ